ncbi:MAG: prmC 1 [Phycisphaerales bacterium]|nr:prmC 1 [Phycisphaerales bacterium]
MTQETVIGSLRFPFTRVADPDRVLDEVAAEADLRDRLHGRQTDGNQLHLPYWAELWDSAWGMGTFLERAGLGDHGPTNTGEAGKADCKMQNAKCKMQIESGERTPTAPQFEISNLKFKICDPPHVLDLGCGMGLAGTVAAALGAKVLFADLEPAALLFAALNSLPWRNRVRTRRLDWQRGRLAERFDLILGADILYERAQWPFLEPFWRAHLAPGGSVLLGEPGRQTGDLFVDWIKPRGWDLTRYEEPVATRPTPIRLLHIQPSPG